ncbi:MAG: PKD domain-containing protein [Methanospirillum sp.]
MTDLDLLRTLRVCLVAVAALIMISSTVAAGAAFHSAAKPAGLTMTAPDGSAGTMPFGGGPVTRAVADGPVITSISPQIASAGTETVITITGTGFGTNASPGDVGFLGAGANILWASGRTDPSYNPNDIVSWSDTEVRVRVPTGIDSEGYIVSASSGVLCLVTGANRTSELVPFAVSFGVMKKKWAAPPVFVVNDNCPNVTGGAAAVRRAVATWNSALPASFQIDASGSTTKTAFGEDGVNVIAWGDDPGTWIWWNDDGEITEADIILPSSDAWTTGVAGGSVTNIESWILADIAFCIGINPLDGYLWDGPNDMGKAVFNGRSAYAGNENLVTLHPADRAAAAYLYGGGSANPPLLAAAFTTNGSRTRAPCTVGFADASLGGATGWRWDFGDGGTSTERNPAYTYTVPGNYTVSLTVSAAGYPSDTIRSYKRIRVRAPVALVPGGAGLPGDTNGDWFCDDVNGNGRADFNDVVLFFNEMSWIAANEPADGFDCNENGRIDFADIVWLFNNL